MSQPATMWPSLNGAPDPWPRRIRRSHIALAVVAIIAVYVLNRLVAPPTAVNQVILVNPTPYDLTVDVTGGSHSGWLGIGTVGRQATTPIPVVLDQGATWVFRFEGQGQPAGQMQLSHDELKRDGWRVSIPLSVTGTLQTQGAQPPP